MTAIALPGTPAAAFEIITKIKFKPFDKMDFDAFAGAQSENPFIGYWKGLTVIIDGDTVEFINDEDFINFELS